MQLAGRGLHDNEGNKVMGVERRKRRALLRGSRGKAGETLTETLVSMLIIGLASVLFITMVGASGRIFRGAEKKYKEIYGKITAAEVQQDVLTNSENIGKISIGTDPAKTVKVKVNWYGDTDYVLSYKAD